VTISSAPYPHIFSPFKLGPLALKNRLVMSAMSSELGEKDGSVSAQMIAFYKERAIGGMGLIIVEYACVDPDTGRSNDRQLTLESRQNLNGHVRLVRTIHEHGACALIQIQHSGQYANREILPDKMPVAPSDIFSKKDPSKLTARGLSSEEILALVERFGCAAELAIEAGYDGVELHGAHGYLLTQFISPLANRRVDAWGGDPERRMAFPLAVIRRVRRAIGERPLVYRISADEFTEGGITIDDMTKIAPHLVAAGATAIHCSTGWGVGAAFETVIEPMSAQEGWRLPYARRIRDATRAPVIGVGQIRWPETAENAIAQGMCDLVALGRPMLADPQWANKARAGNRDLIRPCTSCNWCIGQHPGRHQVGCAENPRTGSELDAPLTAEMGKGRRVDVVGAGPAGAAAALMLDQAGFSTHLYDARNQVGGSLTASASPPGKEKLIWYRDYLRRQIEMSGVTLHLGTAVSASQLALGQPTFVVVAAGTASLDLPIAGLEDEMVVGAYEVLMGDCPLDLPAAARVVIYGGGETGCETAEFMAHRGVHVTLVTRSPEEKLARAVERVYRVGLLRRIRANPLISIIANSHVTHACNRVVSLKHVSGATQCVEVDRLILAQGRQSRSDLAEPLLTAGIPCFVIGDSNTIGRIGDAIHAAYQMVTGLAGQFGRGTHLNC
jgi:2,4-dienoyl-CoA reductase (NADPH2)